MKFLGRTVTPARWLQPSLWAGMVLLVMMYAGFPNRVDLLLYDSVTDWLAPTPHSEIAIVAVDAKSLAELGRWPWSRALLANIVDRMAEVGARGVAMDIALNEPNKSDPAGDKALEEAIARYRNVVLPVFPERSVAPLVLGEALPFEALRSVAALGHVDVEIESDGVSRSAYLRAGFGSARYPTLALALLEVVDGVDGALYIGMRSGRRADVDAKSWVRDYATLVPFLEASNAVPTWSFVDVLRDDAVAAKLAKKWVILGVTAQGLRTSFVIPGVPSASLISGVEYHASVLNALLQARLIQQAAFPVHIALAMLCMLAPFAFYSRLPSRRSTWVWAASIASVLVGWLVSLYNGWWFPPSPALMVLVVGFGVWTWAHAIGTERALHRERKRTQATLLSVEDGVMTTDTEWRVSYMNPACQSLLGQRNQDVRGKSVREVLRFESARDQRRLEDLITYCSHAQDTAKPPEPFMLARGDSGPRAVRLSVSPILSHEVGREHYVLALSDVSKAVDAARKVIHQANHDVLTDLPSRALLADRLQQSIGAAERSAEMVAILCLDLDGFKRINDSLGHALGDELLKEVAKRLSARRRLSDTVARWSGDEFVILLRGLPRGELVARIAGDLQASLAPPFRLAGQGYQITASIGIALYPRDGTDVQTLLKNADQAMYQAKREGRGQLRFFSEQDDRSGRRRLELEGQLQQAIQRDELVVVYQPQMSLRSGAVVGMEALLRWQQPQQGLVLPDQFMAVAEEANLTGAIGERVMQLAFTQLRDWERGEAGFRTLSINLSTHQLMQPGLLAHLDRIVEGAGVSAQLLKVEVTETLLASDSAEVQEHLRGIKDRGIRVVLDDFGTGYSSLSHLRRFMPDELKIHGSYIRDITKYAAEANIVEALIALAHRLNMLVVAEGVETLAQLALLRQLNCDQAQGFYISSAVPGEEVPGVIREIAARAFELDGERLFGAAIH